MNTSTPDRSRARTFVLELLGAICRFLEWPSSIEIVDEDENTLELISTFRRIVADRRTRQISFNGRMVTRFEAIESIDIQYRANKSAEWWVLTLNLGARRRLHVGSSSDSAEASIAAAHLGTITEKEVLVAR